MTLYILKYNNYYNRILKKEATLEAYMSHVLYELQQVNFNPNDHIYTEHIIGAGDYDGRGDYLLVVDDYNEIVSRWFIIEAVRTRGGQYKLELYRDTLVDYYDKIIDSPVFIEKAYLNDNDPLIFNNENMSFNQIKKGEYLLKGELDTPWLVAYLPRYHNGEGDSGTTKEFNVWKGTFDLDPDYTVDGTYSKMSDYEYYDYSTNKGTDKKDYRYYDPETEFAFSIYYKRNDKTLRSLNIYKNRYLVHDIPIIDVRETDYYLPPADLDLNAIDWKPLWESMFTMLNTYNTIEPKTLLPINSYTGLGSYEGYKTLLAEGGKAYEIGGEIYKVSTNGSQEYEFYHTKAINKNDALGLWCWNNVWKKLGFTAADESTNRKQTLLTWDFTLPTISLTLSDIAVGKVSYDFTYDKIITEASPYEILVAPYKNITLTHGGESIGHDGSIAMNWFIDLAKAEGAVYDIQIVPFVGIDSADVSEFDIVKAKIGETEGAWAIKLPYSQFTSTYDTPSDIPIDLTDKKISNECDKYRIVSPNGMGEFEFSPAKNNGFSQFEVDCTLIPFSPYIKISPVFNPASLYGGDYNDFRGLICGGDFSLPIVTSAWETYKLQNKNYQASFDRQIETMEVQNKQQFIQDIVNAATGTVSGAVSGAGAGLFASGGNPYVAAAGAVVGGIFGLGGGIADVAINEKLRNEAIDYAKDQFAYQLQTIQAKPNTLSRTTSYNINNKYFPYVEYYTCTDTEKEALRNKIKYNGMTVMVIGKIADYIRIEETYIKGKLIRLEGIEEDFHIINTIANELNKGVYIK
jgi:hypothetical protein